MTPRIAERSYEPPDHSMGEKFPGAQRPTLQLSLFQALDPTLPRKAPATVLREQQRRVHARMAALQLTAGLTPSPVVSDSE